MRHVVQGKYNVAWFKLAEFISRGEKEKALGLYKLLMHSFDDYALGCQLAGDILLSFNDKEGIEKYKQAADLYKNSYRFLEAIGLYEQLHVLTPDDPLYLYYIIDLYVQLESWRQVQEVYVRIIIFCISHDQHPQAHDFIEKYRDYVQKIPLTIISAQMLAVHTSCLLCEDIITLLQSIALHEY